jgi:hypothetical protein
MIVREKSGDNFSEFNKDLKREGFHIFSKKNAKIKGYYPEEFPKENNKELDIKDLVEGDLVTIRVFFVISKFPVFQADGGYIDLEIELIEDGIIYGNILTELPAKFPLAKNSTLELRIDEILKKV